MTSMFKCVSAENDEGQQLRAGAGRLRDDGGRNGYLLRQDRHSDGESDDGRSGLVCGPGVGKPAIPRGPAAAVDG